MSFKNDQVSLKETEYIINTASKCLVVPGDFVELGCYKGDTSLLLAEVLKDSDKKLWIYDSFEGLPEKSAFDNSLLGEDFKKGELLVTKREVKERFLRAGLKVPVIKKVGFLAFLLMICQRKFLFVFLMGIFMNQLEVV